MNFMDSMSETLNPSNVKYTENGAKAFGTTGHALLDLNFSVASLRGETPSKIINLFMVAYDENKELALKWLFFLRDIREGLGERNTFYIIADFMADTYPEVMAKLIHCIPEYGRWDDLLYFINGACGKIALAFISRQLKRDIKDMKDGKPVSLLAKWLPSINASSKNSRYHAEVIARSMRWHPSKYRKNLAMLRRYIDVVEVKMTSNRWDSIKYPNVPSRAMLIYKKAFMKHDSNRFRTYLDNVANGTEKINISTLFAHDIIHKMMQYINDCDYTCEIDESNEYEIKQLELMWDKFVGASDVESRTLVVRDGSFSMITNKAGGKGKITCMDVGNALTLYFARKLKGEFHNKFVTFSRSPMVIDLNCCETTTEMLCEMNKQDECANTNIEAVFDLILETAIDNNMRQDEIPDNILILSDMEFDSCVEFRDRCKAYNNPSLFDSIRRKYEFNHYKLPRITFWNICSRTGAIPMKENELGCCLVSGFSTKIINMVINGETDPYQNLVNTLMSDRYKQITL